MTETIEEAAEVEWVLCHGCRVPVYGKRLIRNLHVCPECGLHLPVTARQRLAQLADDGRFEPLPFTVSNSDPLDFVDTVAYTDRLSRAQERTGMREAVLCVRTTIEGNPAIVAVMDFRFLGGSLGTAVGELITLAIETAQEERVPLIMVTASGGARMQEGVLSLMQMAKTSAALGELDKAGILSVSVITDPTFGGVAASFATLGDVIIAEPRARLGFAGRRVIEQTIRQRLPEDFQTAEFLLERGFVDMIVERSSLRAELGKLLRIGGSKVCGRYASTARPAAPVVTDPNRLPEADPWDQVGKARALDRPTALDYLGLAFDDFQELHGDRASGECPALIGGTAWIDAIPVMVLAHQKGHTAAELARRNYGMASPAGYRKAARLMRLADKLGLPVVTLVDTPGAHPGAEAEEQGQSVAIAENLRLMATLSVPVVSVIIGEGGSGGALALAVANRVLMYSDSIYSVISPEGCAAIVWKDPSAAPTAARALRLNARELLRLGVVDAVLPEPDGGTGAAPWAAAERLRAALSSELHELAGLGEAALRVGRRARFRQFGSAITVEAELLQINDGRLA
ncbi:acetyl-CoA carboxylase, carboxyltransferase subunit beta [Streptomyces netropsis]|uniref:acetyl-CoA carboxylase, carboxyltransferase subunit beta n=1 Tax=Streptomyces netropsis TaxID=55404 RepID=UPI0037A5C81D